MIKFTIGFLAGIAILEAFAGEWAAMICALVGLVIIRIVTQE